MTDLKPIGTYCMAAGHSQFDCPGEGPEHIDLYRQGYGISRIPGPTDAELREETHADRDLMASEFHGRDLDGSIRW